MLRLFFLLIIILVSFSATSYSQSGSTEIAKAYIYFELGPSTAATIAEKFKAFDETLNEDKTLQGYVMNYGTARAIKKRRPMFLRGINYRRYDVARITFVDIVTKQAIKTLMWVVPEGAATPTP